MYPTYDVANKLICILYLVSIRHDSEHDTWMRDQTDRSVLFVETDIAFLRH